MARILCTRKLWQRGQFHASFARALGHALADLGLSESIVRTETAAIEFEPLARLADRCMRKVLDDVEFMCGIELSYHDDLRIVQKNLNAFPHPDRDPCVPVEGIRQLLAGPPSHLPVLH